MAEKINSSFSDYEIKFQPTSSYLTGDLVQINVPYAASHSNNYSNQVDEIDLSLDNEVKSIYDIKTLFGEETRKALEQKRKENNVEIERLQNEIDSLNKLYQEFLKDVPLDNERETLIKKLENELNILQMNASFSSGLAQEDEISRLKEQISVLQKEREAEILQYIIDHPNEFKSVVGMGFEEYNMKLTLNNASIVELQAMDYELRQEAKEAPYKELMTTEEYQVYALSYNGVSEKSKNYLENRNLVDYLDDEQLKMFSYLYDTIGFAAANEYLKAIEDRINLAKGMEEAQIFLSKITDENGNVDVGALEYTFKTMRQGLGNGIETFGEGFENLFDVTSDGVITDNQYAQQYILQGLSELQKNGQLPTYLDDTYQISTSIGNMLPGSVISILTGGTFGHVLMGMSAAGNAKNEALVSMSDNKALAYIYGTFNGLSEAAVGKALGNIPGLNEGAKFAAKEILSEGVEEFAQTYVDAGLKAIVYHEIPDLGELTEEGLRSFMYGCITSGIMTGSQAGISFTINGAKYTYNSLNELISAYNDGKIVTTNTESVNNAAASNLINDSTDSDAIALANERTRKGLTQTFRFSDVNHMPDINSSFWTSFNNPELIQINVDGRVRTFDDAISYKMQNDLNIGDIAIENNQVADNATAASETDLNGIIRNLVQQQGINETMKGLWYYVYGNDLSFIPEKFRTMVQQFSVEIVEDLLTYEQIKSIADSDITSVNSDTDVNDVQGVLTNENSTENTKNKTETRVLYSFSREYKAQILNGIRAMNQKYRKNVGLDSLRAYILTGNDLLLSSAGNFRQIVTSLDRNTLTECYNEIVNDMQMLDDVLRIANLHDQKYGKGMAIKMLLNFVNPNSDVYNNYDVITSNGGARNILQQYTVEQIATVLTSMGYKVNTINSKISDYFAYFGNSANQTYGCDQGGVNGLCKYYYNGIEYTYSEAMQIINDARNNGRVIPHFSKRGTIEYFNLKNKLLSQGFSSHDASIILSTIDDAGACSYAAVVNEIFASFIGREVEFEKYFGYPMFRVDDTGNKILNSNELLLDLYVFANKVENGGSFILNGNILNSNMLRNDRVDVFGRNMLDAFNQAFMSHGGSKDNAIVAFLNSKGLDYNWDILCDNMDCSTIDDNYFREIINCAKINVNNGYVLSLDIFSHGNTINMNSTLNGGYSCSTSSWNEGGGHAIFVTAVGDDCFYVSSWGREFTIPFTDLKNGGRFCLYVSSVN